MDGSDGPAGQHIHLPGEGFLLIVGGGGEFQTAASLVPAGDCSIITNTGAVCHHHGGLIALSQHHMEAQIGLRHSDQFKDIGGLPRCTDRPGFFGHRHAQFRRRNGGGVQIVTGIGHHGQL